MSGGSVALVGAGPGDKGLLTLRGAELLSKAEVVVYDRLVTQEILDMIPAGAERIDVGKQSGDHPVPQEEINRILLRKAREGGAVVRLKGGDPFVFGRGGEELELLSANGIPFEVVPGITSAVAAPAYAGIPVTHRDFCSSLHIVTGHARAGGAPDLDFGALAALSGTLVFLMGVSSLETITNGLLAAGMGPRTPAAVIENGTRPAQRKVVSPLAHLAEKARDARIASPAVIVVGDVCGLSERFGWFEKRPLFGRAVVVTRPADSVGVLSGRLRALGAQVLECPCVEVAEIPENDRLDEAVEQIGRYRWLVFTSKNGVELFFEGLNRHRLDARALAGAKLAALGPRTAQALESKGLTADYIPETYDGGALGRGLAALIGPDDRALLCRALKGDRELPGILSARGILFDELPVYDTVFTAPRGGELLEWCGSGREVVAAFTSASAVEGFVRIAGDAGLSSVFGVCIGEKTAAAARKYGIGCAVAEHATIDSMIEKLLEVRSAWKA